MASILEQLNQEAARRAASGRRGGVSVYAPNRNAQRAVNPPAQQRPASKLDQMLTAFSSTPEAQKVAQDKAEAEARRNMPLWGKGLGMVFGNPISRVVLNGLEYLSYPRKLIEAGLGELTTHTPEWMELGLSSLIDEEKVKADDRSVWDKVRDPEFGFGQMIIDTDNKWLNRGLGLTGDVLLDPTTYVTGGALKAAGAPKAIETSTRAATAGARAAETAAQTKRLVDEGASVLDRIIAQSQQDIAAQAARQADEAAQAAAAAVRTVPARANRAGRVGELGELALRTDEEFLLRNADELQRIAQRGYGAARSDEVRRALGLVDPSLRIGGARIPGTGAIARGLESAGGAIRGGINSVLPEGLIGRTGGRGLEREFVELIRNGAPPSDVARALTTVGMKNVMREGKQVQLAGNVILGQLTRDMLGRLDPAERAALVSASETAGQTTALNDFFNQMADLYKTVSGREVRRLNATTDTYVPHMLTPEFRRFLAGRSPEAEEFRRAAGFAVDDLLEGSGYIEKARQLVPGKKITIGGQKITIGDGTIAGLNRDLRQAFPQITKFYEDDPIRIAEAYVGSLSRSAGKERAVQRAASSPNQLVRTVTGDLEAERQAYTEALEAQDTTFAALAQGADLAEPLTPAPAIPESRFFRGGTNEALTREREALLRTQGPSMVRASRKEGKQEFADLVAEVERGRAVLRDDLMRIADARKPAAQPEVYVNRIKRLEKQLAALEKKFLATPKGVDLPNSREELTKFLVRTQGEIEDMEQALVHQVALGRRRLTAAQKRAPKQVEKQIEQLREIERRALALVDDPTPLIEAVRIQRQTLDAPVLRAQEALRAKIESIRPKYTAEDVAAAREIKRAATEAEKEGKKVSIRSVERAERILKADAEWRADVQRLSEPERQALKAAQERRRELRNSMRYTLARGTFEETPEGRLMPGVETMIRERPLREELAQEATRRRIAAEQNTVNLQDQARRSLRLESEARTEELLAPLTEQIAQATGRRKIVLRDLRARLRLLDEHTQAFNIALQKDRQALVKIRQDMANMKIATDQAASIGGDLKKVSTSKEIAKKVLEPMERVVAANPDLSDEALNTTEALLDDAAERMFRLGQRDMNEAQVQHLIERAQEGRLAPVMMAVLNDNWRLMHPGNVGEGSVIMDAELARRFQNLFALDKQPGLFGRTLNSLTNLFKTYATLSPGFHVRNGMSAIFMNTSDGVSLANQLRGAKLWKQYMEEGEEWLARQSQQTKDAFTAIAGTGAGGRFTEAGVAETIDANRRGAGIYNRLASNRITRLSQRVGSDVEGAVRLGMALDSIGNGETIQGAIQRISRVHFDYSDTSQLDEAAKRLIPFWTFMSRNMPLQVSQMWTKPRVYQQYANLVRNFRGDDIENTPQYWTDAGAFNTGLTVPENDLPILGAASGLPIFGQPDLGFTRLQQDTADLERALSGEDPMGIFANVNPWFTAPAEYITRRDFFTGQEFPEGEGYEDVGGIMSLLRPLAMMTGNTNEAGQVDPRFLNALQSLNPLLGRSERLLPQVTGGDDEARRRQAESIARFLGAPIRTLTPKQQDNEYLRRYYEALDEMRRQQQLAS